MYPIQFTSLRNSTAFLRGKSEASADLCRVQVLVHKAVDYSRAVVEEEVGAGGPQAREQLVGGQANLVEEVEDFLFCLVGSDPVVNLSDNVDAYGASELIVGGGGRGFCQHQRGDHQQAQHGFHLWNLL